MFLIVTRNFPPDVGGMQILMGGLSESLLNHGPVKVFAYEFSNASKYDNKTSMNIVDCSACFNLNENLKKIEFQK